ncbi:hypothetical protein E4U53_000444, partial [Claviceps sorghi]
MPAEDARAPRREAREWWRLKLLCNRQYTRYAPGPSRWSKLELERDRPPVDVGDAVSTQGGVSVSRDGVSSKAGWGTRILGTAAEADVSVAMISTGCRWARAMAMGGSWLERQTKQAQVAAEMDCPLSSQDSPAGLAACACGLHCKHCALLPLGLGDSGARGLGETKLT